MKKLFKNIAKSAKSAAINCQTSIAAFHRRAVCGNAGEGPSFWAPWCWPACTRS